MSNPIPKYQVNISHIAVPLSQFNALYTIGLESSDPAQLLTTIEKMSTLQEEILKGLKSAKLPLTRLFQWGTVTSENSANPDELTQEIQEKLSDVILKFSNSSNNNSLTDRVSEVRNPFYSNMSRPQSQNIATDYAVGFANAAANCWANALLSMVIHVPSLKQAYFTVAEYYANQPTNYLDSLYGHYLLDALKEYDKVLNQKPIDPKHPKIVPAVVTQNVRLAFNHFFGKTDPSGRSIFSIHSFVQEDASEAMEVLMGRYEEILRSRHQFDSPPHLYNPLATKRLYRPEGNPKPANPVKLKNDGYSKLREDHSSIQTAFDYQIFIDLQSKNHLSFPALVADFFKNTSMSGSDLATYLRSDGLEQQYTLVGEARQFTQVPQEFMLTIKRFGKHNDGSGYKISAPVMVSRTLVLPVEATTTSQPIAYDLDSFIVHSGDFGAGHYISYKKINNRWIEADDGNVRFVSDFEIDQILQGQKRATYTSYLHHYSRIPTSHQQSAIATSNQAIPSQMTTSLTDLTINKLNDEKQGHEQSIACLNEYAFQIQRGADSTTLLNSLGKLESSSPHITSIFRHIIWLHDKTPDIYEYGTTTLNANPRKLYEIQLPWLIASHQTLLDQMIATQLMKLKIAEAKLHEAQMRAFLEKMNNSSLSGDLLLKALTNLPERLQWNLHELIYKSHLIKFGKTTVDKAEYGRTALETEKIREVLTAATETVLNLYGNNIVEQLTISFRIAAEKLQYTYERMQLQAFHDLLTRIYPEPLTNKQLAEAFERLEIRKEIKDKFHWLIWCADGMPNTYNYGSKTFANNPRCLLSIIAPLLTEPPICDKQADILTQMIALLNKESI